MKKIFKYTLEITDRQEIEMQDGEWLDILCVKEQNGNICLWAIVDPSAPMAKRKFAIYGTGHPMPDDLSDHAYLGTVQTYIVEGNCGGKNTTEFVWHVFEIC